MEIGLVLIIALIVFGPKRLPELGKSLGKGISEFRGTISGEKSESEETPAVEPAAAAPVVVAPAPATAAKTGAHAETQV
jgi:sec-independent protein translocase protein TatA